MLSENNAKRKWGWGPIREAELCKQTVGWLCSRQRSPHSGHKLKQGLRNEVSLVTNGTMDTANRGGLEDRMSRLNGIMNECTRYIKTEIDVSNKTFKCKYAKACRSLLRATMSVQLKPLI